MKIEAGKHYRTRDGQKVGPMIANTLGKYTESHPWREKTSPDSAECYRHDGSWGLGTWETDHDLIAEWRDEPDLTAIKTPFGLLDRETQEALKAHGGPYELFTVHGWQFCGDPYFSDVSTFRVNPAPPKPREFWLIEWDTDAGPADCIERTEQDAIKSTASLMQNGHRNVRVSRFREVLPE